MRLLLRSLTTKIIAESTLEEIIIKASHSLHHASKVAHLTETAHVPHATHISETAHHVVERVSLLLLSLLLAKLLLLLPSMVLLVPEKIRTKLFLKELLCTVKCEIAESKSTTQVSASSKSFKTAKHLVAHILELKVLTLAHFGSVESILIILFSFLFIL